MSTKATFVKSIRSDDLIEPWIYRTFSHSAMITATILEGKYSTAIQMPKGEAVSDLNEQSFKKMFGTLIDFILFMEENGVVYGDVKTENMLMLNDFYHVIDFGMMHFTRLPYTIVTQTYIANGPALQSRILQDNLEEDGCSHTRLLFAIGFMVFRWVHKIHKITHLLDYQTLINDKRLYTNCGEWAGFINVCMVKQSIERVVDLLPYIPFSITRSPGIVRYTPTPNLPTKWNDTLDRHNSTFYGLTLLFTDKPGIYPITMQLYWRYMGVITTIKTDDDIKTLYCACLAISCLLVGWSRLSIATLAFHANIDLTKMQTFWVEFRSLLQDCLPSLFRDGYAPMYKSIKREVFYHRIGNPLNIERIRSIKQPTNECIITDELKTIVSRFIQ